ncbi:MAG: hypothetical protein JSV80_12700, partial [Acidobacteriota bacterium]
AAATSSISRLALTVCTVVALSGCSETSIRELERVASGWFDAVQQRDYERLARFDDSAPLEREGPVFDAWSAQLDALLDRYEAERDAGAFEPDPHGYLVVRATMLGAGAFWESVSREGDGNQPELVIRLNLGYGEINYGTLPPFTTVYLLGDPLGTVHAIVLGEGRTHEIDILEQLMLRIGYARPEALAAGDEPIKVARLAWIDSSAVHRHVRWTF